MKVNGAFAGVAALLCAGVAFGQGSDLDLPVSKPVYEVDGEPPVPDDPSDPEDDPPPTFIGQEIGTEGDELLYVVDLSGSMNSDVQSYTHHDGTQASGARIDRAKSELVRSIRGLAERFEFNVIAYDCSAQQWSQAPQSATASNKAAAIAWILSLRPGGATGTGPACATAVTQSQTVILLTDGAPNCGASGMSAHRRMIAQANVNGARVHVFGIAASGSYRGFCRGVAADNGGDYVDVP